MAEIDEKVEENVKGKFYVDQNCIDCDLCRGVEPQVFTRSDENGYSFVFRQPETVEEFANAEDAKDMCPVDSIGNDG